MVGKAPAPAKAETGPHGGSVPSNALPLVLEVPLAVPVGDFVLLQPRKEDPTIGGAVVDPTGGDLPLIPRYILEPILPVSGELVLGNERLLRAPLAFSATAFFCCGGPNVCS